MSDDVVRATALEVLRAVDERDAYVNLTLPGLLRERGLVGRDAALATELVHGTLRRQGTYDAVIASLVQRELDPPVLDILRLGTHQLLSMRVPPHAAVSTSVDLVRRHVGHKPAGLVNAVLRKVGQKDLDGWVAHLVPGLDADDALAVRYSHPAWVVRALREAVGADELESLLAADNLAPRVTLVARPGLVDPAELPGRPGTLSPWARVLDEGGAPGDLAPVRDGRAGVQDEGSQLVALTLADVVLDRRPGPGTPAGAEGSDERWLDLCAGPGGKAALLGALAQRAGAHLVANEVQPHRARLVRSALQQLPDVEVTVHDGRAGPWEPGTFDRVLVDAPCTGLGALRRRPESRWRRRASDLDDLVPLQRDLLSRALDLVRPGGVVVYATCSPHVAETTGVVDAVTAGRDDVAVEARQQWWPHVHGTDAMFAATLRRR